MFSVKTYQLPFTGLIMCRVLGTFHSAANITSADVFNDIIVLATDANQLLLLNAYEMIEPIACCGVDEAITAIRFNHATKTEAKQPVVFTPIQSPAKSRYSIASPSSYDSVMEAARNQVTQNGEKQASGREDSLRQAVKGLDTNSGLCIEVVYPMMIELQTYVHREISDLKADMVRQFSEQELVIQRQQDQIEQLVQLLQQRR